GTRHEAEIERTDARGNRMKNRKAVPSVFDGAEFDRRFGGKRRNARAIFARERTRAQNDERALGLPQRFGKLAGAQPRQRLRTGAEVLVGISEIGLLADQR